MTTNDNKKTLNLPNGFECKLCDFKCSYIRDYNRHIETKKHKNNEKTTFYLNYPKFTDNIKLFLCESCDKQFKDRPGLWRHKKKCINKTNNNEKKIHMNNKIENTTENTIVNKLLEHLIKENSEMKILMMQQQNSIIENQNLVLEICKNGTHNINYSNNNSNNKTFNLNVFLNETCKDAMNISDFADSIKLELSDLESVGELGYVNGISNIIIKNLKELDITRRPIHCTDAKRETLYIKDKDKWEKQGEQKEIIVKFVSNVANKNIRMLSEFKKKYPDCCKYESKYSDYYSKLIIEAMGGSGGTDAEKHEKIVKKICKEVTIDKTVL
jgi:hypothetical protein